MLYYMFLYFEKFLIHYCIFSFEGDPFKKHCLLNGLDDIGLTMEKEDQITAYESKAAQIFPWA